MAYSTITPATLANLATADVTKPADGEAAIVLGAVDRQTRAFIYDYLATKFDVTTEMLKPGVIADASVVGKVKGSTANSAGTEQGIVQGTVSTPDFRAGAVDATALATDAVITAKIANLQVTTGKLADDAVTGAKVADLAIDTNHIALDAIDSTLIEDNAVTESAILAGAVTAAKLATNCVGPDQLALASSTAQILVADANKKFQAVTMTGDATISTAGVLTLVATGTACLQERTSKNTNGGAAVVTTWNVRGSSTSSIEWVKAWDTLASSFVTIGTGAATGKVTLAAGTYIIEASAPGYKVGAHKVRLQRYSSADASQEIIDGTAELSPAAAALTTRSFVSAKMVFAAGDYFKLEHYTTLAEALDGLGIATNVDTYEIYATVKIQKIA